MKCWGKPSSKTVRTVELDEDSAEEVFQTGQGGNLDNTQLITLKLENGSHIRFQADTGAQYNVIPLGLYKKASKDHHLQNIKPVQQQITAYCGTTIPVCGAEDTITAN